MFNELETYVLIYKMFKNYVLDIDEGKYYIIEANIFDRVEISETQYRILCKIRDIFKM